MNLKKEKCNYIDCKGDGVGRTETAIGWFCSEECRTKIDNNFFKVLAFPSDRDNH